MNKNDFKKGQEVFLRVVPGSNAGRMRGIDKATARNDYDTSKAAIGQQIITGEVISAGRKYITVAVEGRLWNEAKFNVTNNFRQDHDNDYQLFLTWDDAVERIWRDALSHNLRRKLSSTLDTDLTLEQLQQINGIIHNTEFPLTANVYTDVLIEVAMAAKDYVGTAEPYGKILVEIANDYVADMKKAPIGVNHIRRIDAYTKLRLIEDRRRRGIIDTKPWYFTFGSDTRFPYQNTYMVVYAKEESSAIGRYRQKYPDRHEGIVNCAFWYSEEKWENSESKKAFDSVPAEVMW